MIPEFTIKRVSPLSDATLGVMLDEEQKPVCLTAELPWKNNKPFVSCIPPGLYEAIRITSPSRGYELFQFVEVPGRTLIQIHIANAPMRTINDKGDTELLGCIAPGLRFGGRDGYNGVNSSGKAFAHFMGICKNTDTILLKIVNCY